MDLRKRFMIAESWFCGSMKMHQCICSLGARLTSPQPCHGGSSSMLLSAAFALSCRRIRLGALTRGCRLADCTGCPACRYILWEAEERGLLLPYACRMGCCTACAVRVLQGDLYQPQARPSKAPALRACPLPAAERGGPSVSTPCVEGHTMWAAPVGDAKQRGALKEDGEASRLAQQLEYDACDDVLSCASACLGRCCCYCTS